MVLGKWDLNDVRGGDQAPEGRIRRSIEVISIGVGLHAARHPGPCG